MPAGADHQIQRHPLAPAAACAAVLSIAFYQSLFGVEPAKRRPGYANFAVAEPQLKLVLIEGEPDRPTVMDHLGVELSACC